MNKPIPQNMVFNLALLLFRLCTGVRAQNSVVYDFNGRQVQATKVEKGKASGQREMRLASIHPGVYAIVLRSEEGEIISAQKVIVQ